MADFSREHEDLYSQYQQSMDKVGVIDDKLKELEGQGKTKLIPEMELGFTGRQNANAEYSRHLAFTKEALLNEQDKKFEQHFKDNNIPAEQQGKFKNAFAERYQKEKIKNFEKSQEFMNAKLEQSKAGKSETTKDLNQSQEYASKLLEQSKAKGMDANTTEPAKDETTNNHYSMSFSYEQMEQNLENDVEQNKEPEMEVDKDIDDD